MIKFYYMQAIEKALTVLREGGVVVHATETCYGFACDIFNKKALARLYSLKQMKNTKPVSIMVGSFKEAPKYGYFSKEAQKLAKKYWPGPLTIIVKRKKILPPFLNPKSKTIGIRIPNHKLSFSLIEKFGNPLVTTSANISGKQSPYSISAIKKQFAKQKIKPDFYLNSSCLRRNKPSTIIDMSGDKAKIIREGDFMPDLVYTNV